MSVKCIIFDLDGTLLYTLEDLKNSTNFALNKLGLEICSIDEIKSFVGNGIDMLIKRALKTNQDKFTECLGLFLNHYKTNSLNTTKPYNKAISTLEKLKSQGFKLAILSNKVDYEVKKLSKHFFGSIFDISLGQGHFPKKPDPCAVYYIIKQFNLTQNEALFIGDSTVDMQTARNSGIECLSVGWGYQNPEFLLKSGAKRVFNDFLELYEFISKVYLAQL